MILALDLATVTGWALGDSSGVQGSGIFRAPSTGEDVGTFLSGFRVWITGQLQKHQPRAVVFESPILPAKTQLHVLRKLYGLAGVTEMVAVDHKVRCLEAARPSVLRHFLGAGYRQGSEFQKAGVMTRCRQLGWRPVDNNEGDALALLDFAISIDRPNHALQVTPLFRGALVK